MEKGQQIMIRSTFNQPVIRRYWAEFDGMVIIFRDEAMRKNTSGIPANIAISKKDVFEYDVRLFEQMKKYDERIDSFPKELDDLWLKAIPLYKDKKPIPIFAST
jgi:hypothetical protein